MSIRLKTPSIFSAAGFGAHLGLVSFIGWPVQSPLNTHVLFHNYSVSDIFSTATMLFIIILYVINKKIKINMIKIAILYTSILAISCAIQTVAPVASFSTSIAYVLDCCAASFTGIGTILGYILWQQMMFRLGSKDSLFVLATGTCIGALLYFLFIWLPLDLAVFRTIPYLALLSLSTYSLFETEKRLKKRCDIVINVDRGTNIGPAIKELALAIVCISAFGVVWGIFSSASSRVDSPTELLGELFSLGRLLSGIAILPLIGFFDAMSPAMPYRVIYPCLIAAFAILPSYTSGFYIALSSIAYCFFSFSSIITLYYCNKVSYDYKVHPIVVYCISFCIIYSSSNIGAALVRPIALDHMVNLSRILAFALLLIYIIILLCESKILRKQGHLLSPSPSALVSKFPVAGKEMGLTKREYDVLLLLLKGRSVPVIARQLSVSENTVRSHTKSIYRKLGLHSKQELIDAFESPEDPTHLTRSM